MVIKMITLHSCYCLTLVPSFSASLKVPLTIRMLYVTRFLLLTTKVTILTIVITRQRSSCAVAVESLDFIHSRSLRTTLFETMNEFQNDLITP